MDIFSQIKLLLKKPRVVIISGQGRKTSREAVLQVLKSNFRVGEDVLLFETDLKDTKEKEKLRALTGKSSLPVLAVTHLGQIAPEFDYMAGDREAAKEIAEFAKIMPPQTFLILNFDDESMKEISGAVSFKTLTFGFQEGADLRATDLKVNGDTNFKINFNGNIVPVWLEGKAEKEKIYASLLASCVGTLFDLNLIEISQALKGQR